MMMSIVSLSTTVSLCADEDCNRKPLFMWADGAQDKCQWYRRRQKEQTFLDKHVLVARLPSLFLTVQSIVFNREWASAIQVASFGNVIKFEESSHLSSHWPHNRQSANVSMYQLQHWQPYCTKQKGGL
jgi:hypothetical protein